MFSIRKGKNILKIMNESVFTNVAEIMILFTSKQEKSISKWGVLREDCI